MKKLTFKTLIVGGLAASLAAFAIACGDDDDEKTVADGGSTAGTGCKAFICDSSGTVRQGALGEQDEYAASSGCSYEAIGTCINGCDTHREIVRLPGCSVGNACTVVPRNLAAPVNVSALTSCAKETLSDTDACEGYPCLSRNLNGMPLKPFFCAVKVCDSDSDCAEDEFCRCKQDEEAANAYTSERWCVKKPGTAGPSTGDTDAGVAEDAGTAEDAGVSEDAGIDAGSDGADAALEQDASEESDAAVEPDASAEEDAAVDQDASEEPDASEEADAAVDQDASES